MSVLLVDVMIALGCRPSDALQGHERFALAALTAGLARKLDQKVARDPLRDEPAHALVCGDKKKACKEFARRAEWVVPPPDHMLEAT